MSDCQPQTVFLMPDPSLSGSANVQSVTSQAGACTPTVVTDSTNCGTLLPMVSGVPEDPSAPPIELQIQSAGKADGATFVWRPTGAADFRGMDDGRKLIRADAPFRDGAFPNMLHGEAATYVPGHKRLIVTTTDPVAGEFLLRYRDVEALYDDWTDLAVPPPTGAPAITDGQPFQRSQLVTLGNGVVLLAYAYVRVPQVSLDIWDIAILKSEDGGLTWTFLVSEILGGRIISVDGHQFRLTRSDSWIRVDVPLEIGKELLSTASRDGGLSWSTPIEADLSPDQGSTVDVDPSPFTVTGIGGGRFLLSYTVDDDEWTNAQAFGGGVWRQVGGDPALLTRTEDGTIRGFGSTVAHGRVYVVVSYDDGPGQVTDDQMALYFQQVGRVFANGPGALSPTLPLPDEWQPVLPFTRYRGARHLPVRITVVYTEQVLFIYGGLYDVVTDDTQDATVAVQLSHYSVETFGNVSPGGDITTTAFTLLEPLYDVQWQSFTGRPAGAPGASSNPSTEWTETIVGVPTIAWSEQLLRLTTGVGDSVYYDVSVPSSSVSSWVISGTTVGAIVTIVSGSSQVATSHGLRVTSELSRVGFEVRAVLRMDTAGITVFDAGLPGAAGSIAIDMTGLVEVRFRIEEGPLNASPFGLWAARLDDYFNPVAVDGVLADIGTGPADSIRFGALAAGTAGESEWREVWVSEFVTRGTTATFDNPADLLGAPASEDRLLLTNCLYVSWGGGSGAPGDRYTLRPCFAYAASNIFADASSIGWRSTDLAAQSLILRPDDGSTAAGRFVHSGIALFGLEDRTVVVDYDTSPAFGAPTPGGTVDTTLFSDLIVEPGSLTGQAFRFLIGTPPKRLPVSGELAWMRVRFTGGGAVGRTYCVTEHCGTTLKLARVEGGVLVPADLGADGVSGSDPLVAFAPFGFVRYGVGRRFRYMRLRFADTDTCTEDHRLGAIVPGCEVLPPFPLQWRHGDDEQSDVQIFEGPSVSHAYTLGRPRRIWTGRIVGETVGWRKSFRYLVRHLAGYQQRPIVLIPNEDDLRSMVRGRFQPAELENALWFDRDAGDGPYTQPGGDMQIQVVEVP